MCRGSDYGEVFTKNRRKSAFLFETCNCLHAESQGYKQLRPKNVDYRRFWSHLALFIGLNVTEISFTAM